MLRLVAALIRACRASVLDQGVHKHPAWCGPATLRSSPDEAGSPRHVMVTALIVAVGTVQRRVSNIIEKVEAESRLEVVAHARDLGLRSAHGPARYEKRVLSSAHDGPPAGRSLHAHRSTPDATFATCADPGVEGHTWPRRRRSKPAHRRNSESLLSHHD